MGTKKAKAEMRAMDYGIKKFRGNFMRVHVFSNPGPWLMQVGVRCNDIRAGSAVMRPLARRVMQWLRALCWCVVPLLGAPAHAGKRPAEISVITLERICMGCAEEGLLRLQRDGVALLTRPGNARLGRQEQRLAGRFSVQDFEALARQLVAAGFFALDEIYEDPQMRDGSTSTISVELGSTTKRVTSREGFGPTQLAEILAAAESLRLKTEFKVLP